MTREFEIEKIERYYITAESEAKAVEKKTTKEVEDVQAHGYDHQDKSNLDNQIGQEVLNGLYFEGRENPDKTLDEIRKIVEKNLAKDGQYYMKNAAFGVKGLGYKETEVEEVAGKHASSGYSDKLKKMVKESVCDVICMKADNLDSYILLVLLNHSRSEVGLVRYLENFIPIDIIVLFNTSFGCDKED